MSHIQRKYSIKLPKLESAEHVIESIGRIESIGKKENMTAEQLGKFGHNL